MSALTSRQRGRIDLVAYDRSGRPVLTGEVKATSVGDPDELARFTASRQGDVPFVLIVDPVHVRLYRGGPAGDPCPAANLSTSRVFASYDPEFGKGRVFEQYLTSLAEAWLSDLATHWKHAEPPGTAELRGTGLLEQLEGGSTGTEVASDGDPLR